LLAIRRKVLRSSLTVVGLVIGGAAGIPMTTIGAGATAKVTADIAALGTNMLMVRPGQGYGPGGARADAPPFKIDDADAIQREIYGVAEVAPTAQNEVQAIYPSKNLSTALKRPAPPLLPARDRE